MWLTSALVHTIDSIDEDLFRRIEPPKCLCKIYTCTHAYMFVHAELQKYDVCVIKEHILIHAYSRNSVSMLIRVAVIVSLVLWIACK
jgi:hypothetical protein